MISNAPLERLINAVMALDGLAPGVGDEVELRCLMRKIEWVANEAENTLARCTSVSAVTTEAFQAVA